MDENHAMRIKKLLFKQMIWNNNNAERERDSKGEKKDHAIRNPVRLFFFVSPI